MIKTNAIVAVIDHEQGGKQALEKTGYQVYTLFSLSELINWKNKHDHNIII
ncbi:MAG: hypothetical protein ACK4PR_02585 [Gammaproteobacteria bacterium]